MKSYDIPIDFCPKCNNKHITVIMGKSYEEEYSLTGKCLRKNKYSGYTTYTLLNCRKCGWHSKSWDESGYEDIEEYEKLEKLYLERNKNE